MSAHTRPAQQNKCTPISIRFPIKNSRIKQLPLQATSLSEAKASFAESLKSESINHDNYKTGTTLAMIDIVQAKAESSFISIEKGNNNIAKQCTGDIATQQLKNVATQPTE